MPWVSKAEYEWLRARELKAEEYFDRCLERRAQVRRLRKVIHRLVHDMNATANVARREAMESLKAEVPR